MMRSGPAQMLDSNPPSSAMALMIRPEADSANRRRALYKLDLPLPLAPVTTVMRPKGITMSRRER
ncbi:MAG: hypothetical protein NVV73_19555 [Cellvibrionaceae bacterium]|nr:hypothetical protein [Cellvibrionaceae bacterium]